MKDYIINPMVKGYVQVYTGDGKGKTTAALGLLLRAAGAGLKVYMGEFIKEMEYSEVGILRNRFPEVTVELYGIEAGCIIGREPSREDIDRTLLLRDVMDKVGICLFDHVICGTDGTYSFAQHHLLEEKEGASC